MTETIVPRYDHAGQSAAADAGNALDHRLPVPQANDHVFYDVESDKQDSEEQGAQQDRVNEGAILEILAEVQFFSDH